MHQKPRSKGAILLLTTILLFVLLGMVVSLSYVTVMEQKMSSKTKSSVASFYNSESGIEWALNKIATTTGTNPTVLDAFTAFTSSKAPCPSGFSCDVYLLDKDGKVIISPSTLLSDIKAVRSVGSQGGETQRAIEAAVASGSIEFTVLPGETSTCEAACLSHGQKCVAGFSQDRNFEGSPSQVVRDLISCTTSLNPGPYYSNQCICYEQN